MGTTSDKLQNIIDSKLAISGAIAARGVEVPERFAEYGDAVASIPGGYTAEYVTSIVERTASVLPDDVQRQITEVPPYGFYQSAALTSISAVNCTKLGIYSFHNCPSLTTVTVGTLDNGNIPNYCFAGDRALVKVSIPGVKRVYTNTFHNCTSLESIDFADSVTTIYNYGFAYCNSLPEIDFPVCTSVGNNAFVSNFAASAISLPRTTSIGTSVFTYCSAAKTINLPVATSIGSDSLNGLTSCSYINIPKCQTLTTPFGATYNAAFTLPALTSLTLPAIETISAKCFGAAANQIYTPNLADLHIPNKTIAQVKAMANYATWYLPTSCTIHCSDGNFNYGS